MYIAQAKALTQGGLRDLYLSNAFATNNSIHPFGPLLYPFGYPILLAPIYAILGLNFIGFKIYTSLFAILSIPVLFKVFKPFFQNQIFTFCLIACIVLNAGFTKSSDQIFSDLPYFFFSFLALSYFKREHSLSEGIIIGCLIFFSYLIRDVGLFLLPALLVFQLISKEGKSRFERILDLRTWVPFGVFLSAYLLKFLILLNYPANHLNRLTEGLSLGSIFSNLVFYEDLVSSFMFTWDTPSFSLILFFIGLAIIGVSTCWKETVHFLLYALLVAVIIIIWPHKQGERFWYPVLPIFFFFILKGVEIIGSKKPKLAFSGVVFILLWTGIIAVKGGIESFKRNKIPTNQAYTVEMKDHYNYITKNISENEPVLFFKPRVLRFFTKRNSHFVPVDSYENTDTRYFLLPRKDEFQSGEIIYSTERFRLWRSKK